MKKIILVLIVIFALQNMNAQKISYGMKTGINLSNFHGSNEFDNSFKVGFQVGGLAKIPLSDRLYLQPEILYSLQGNKSIDKVLINNFDGGRLTYEYKLRSNLHYIHMPVVVKYYVNDNVNVEFGPQIGYFIKGKSKMDILNSEGGENLNIKIERYQDIDLENKFDVGLNIGVGYDFNKKMDINLRYTYGLVDIFGGISSLKNSVLQLNFEYRFN